jgi:outer membrane immunogenic protein
MPTSPSAFEIDPNPFAQTPRVNEMMNKFVRFIVMLSAFAVASAAITASAQVRSADERRRPPAEDTTAQDDGDDRRQGESRRQQEIRQQEEEDQKMMGQTLSGRNAVGPFLGIITEYDNTAFLGVDGRFSVDLSADQPLIINPAFNYYMLDVEGFTLLQFDANVLYPFMLGGALTPYAGGGLGILYASFEFENVDGSTTSNSDTEIGLNLVGGAEYDFGGPISAFAQLRMTFWEDDLIGLMAGAVYAF